MDPTLVRADRTTEAIVHASRMQWIASPEAGVERRPLERIGGEVAIASTIVRYRPHSRFPRHVHEAGEEFLVLEGEFRDEHGRYPAGTYVRNPPGSAHAPFSDTGCVIFVKLRQMRPDDTLTLRTSFAELEWAPSGDAGIARAPLCAVGGTTVRMERFGAGARRAPREIEGGEELLVVGGSLQLPARRGTVLQGWDWLRNPGRRSVEIVSPDGALVWRKTGHLAAGEGASAA